MSEHSSRCTLCQDSPGRRPCPDPICAVIPSQNCELCRGSGEVKCQACDGHGFTGEFAGTTLA